ncbi:hypothetical protein BDN70DRAFT_448656 [Pholiota conissans]|uniref:C2H2-type domain-containing protein n=1 Tax=Pholiota conissans TaxID=109636 RepID=A0A9P5YQ27_9AGAR|nr:hypothetical protein BDN70DRAFT_448656 [Pholiota conissans]
MENYKRDEKEVDDGGVKKARANGKKHTCPIEDCESSFTNTTDLNRHIDTHFPERLKWCAYMDCDYATHQRSNLSNHVFERKTIHGDLTLAAYNELAVVMQSREKAIAEAEAAAEGKPFDAEKFESHYITFNAVPRTGLRKNALLKNKMNDAPSGRKKKNASSRNKKDETPSRNETRKERKLKTAPPTRTSSWTTGTQTEEGPEAGPSNLPAPFFSPKGLLGTLSNPTPFAIRPVVNEPRAYDTVMTPDLMLDPSFPAPRIYNAWARPEVTLTGQRYVPQRNDGAYGSSQDIPGSPSSLNSGSSMLFDPTSYVHHMAPSNDSFYNDVLDNYDPEPMDRSDFNNDDV